MVFLGRSEDNRAWSIPLHFVFGFLPVATFQNKADVEPGMIVEYAFIPDYLKVLLQMGEINFDADVIAHANHSDWWICLEVAAHSVRKKNFALVAVELFVL